MTRALVAITNVGDYRRAASDLHEFISAYPNDDIESEFPGTLVQYSSLTSAQHNLERLIKSHSPGFREIFVVFAGTHAVGQAIVTVSNNPPDAVDPSSPNVSGWIARPYRGQGIGKFSLRERLKVVEERFGGSAWTLVNKTNMISENNVRAAGFRCVSAEIQDWPQHNLFAWKSFSQEP